MKIIALLISIPCLQFLMIWGLLCKLNMIDLSTHQKIYLFTSKHKISRFMDRYKIPAFKFTIFLVIIESFVAIVLSM